MPFAVAALLLVVEGPILLKTHVESAAIFKPGLAMIVRTAKIPAGQGEYQLDVVPDAYDGAFWYDAGGADIRDVRTALTYKMVKKTFPAKTVPELLYANVGSEVHLMATLPESKDPTQIVAKIEAADPAIGQLTLRQGSDVVRTIPIGNVVALTTSGLKTTFDLDVKVPDLHITFKTETASGGVFRLTTLETGAAWSGSYLVTLEDKGVAHIEGKAQVALGSQRFDGSDVKLMAGFPVLPNRENADLASGLSSLDGYLEGGGRQGTALRLGPIDPYDELQAVLSALNTSNPFARNMYGGYGFGGGMGGGGGLNYTTYDPTTNSLVQSGSTRDLLPSQFGAAAVESLYAYPLGTISLEPGERLTRLLFRDSTTYERLFTWTVSGTNGVRDILRVHNAGKQPWTGGMALILKNDVPLAHLTMPYTPAGKDANLDLAQAADIIARYTEEGVGLDSVKVGRIMMTRYQRTGTLSLENDSEEPATIEATFPFSGTVVDPAGGTVHNSGHARDGINPDQTLLWRVKLSPGEHKDFKAIYTHLG